MAQWDEDIADIIEELIRRANCNQLPVTEAEWRDICARFCVDLFIVRSRCRHSGQLLDDVLVVKRSVIEGRTKSRIAHELSEHLLSSDWHAPVIVPIGDLSEQKHHIARLVEKRLREMQASRRHTVEQQMQAHVQRRQRLEQQRQSLARKMEILQEQLAAEDELLRETELLLADL